MAQYHAESEERMASVYQDAYPIKLKAMGEPITPHTWTMQQRLTPARSCTWSQVRMS